MIINRRDLYNYLLPLLKDCIFHVTNMDGRIGIFNSMRIMNNHDGRFEFSYGQSVNSFGRKRGYVSLFDFRNKDKEEIEDCLLKFYFLNPKKSSNRPQFLILNDEDVSDLIVWEDVKDIYKPSEMIIPYHECWIEEYIPIAKIKYVLDIQVYE